MKHYVSFDIDQTLVNTHSLNSEAYRRFGVTVPEHAIGLRWQTWLYDAVGNREEAEKIHRNKVYLYMDMLRNCDIMSITLPPTELARELLRRPDINVRFVTAGAMTTANVILQRLGLRAPLASNLSYEARRLTLHTTVLSCDGVAVYVDDRKDTIDHLRDDVPGLLGIHYVDQTYADLRATIQAAISVRS